MIKKYLLPLFVLLLLAGVFFTGTVFAKKDDHTFRLPPNAMKVADGVYYLGKAMDHGKQVEGYAYLKKTTNPAKPICGDGICSPSENANKCPADCGSGGAGGTGSTDTSSCYTYLGKDAYWKTTEPYLINPSNPDGLSEVQIVSDFANDIGTWETAANYDILGDGQVSTAKLTASTNAPDGNNEVYFGQISDPNTIGVTIVWGVFNGPPFARELVEWDQVYNTAYPWSLSADSSAMVFDNIATHELGHAVGLGDLYDSSCSTMTMYGYADYGQTSKEVLGNGDINGVSSLYN